MTLLVPLPSSPPLHAIDLRILPFPHTNGATHSSLFVPTAYGSWRTFDASWVHHVCMKTLREFMSLKADFFPDLSEYTFGEGLSYESFSALNTLSPLPSSSSTSDFNFVSQWRDLSFRSSSSNPSMGGETRTGYGFPLAYPLAVIRDVTFLPSTILLVLVFWF